MVHQYELAARDHCDLPRRALGPGGRPETRARLAQEHGRLDDLQKRYWGLALPIWVDEENGDFEVIGSEEELKARAVEGWGRFEGETPHRPYIDLVKIRNPRTGNLMSRIPDVGNPWLDAGI